MTPPADQTEGLWITSDPQPDGTYTLVLSIDGDRSRALTADEAERYGRAVFAVAAAADYEQVSYTQMLDRGVPQDAALQMIADLRRHRPPVDDEATAPLCWVPGLNHAGKAFIRLDLDGRGIGQLTPDDARGHASHVMESVPNATLDGIYRSVLVSTIGLTDREARAVVDHLGSYRS